jgi:copper chaperone CopZ
MNATTEEVIEQLEGVQRGLAEWIKAAMDAGDVNSDDARESLATIIDQMTAAGLKVEEMRN